MSDKLVYRTEVAKDAKGGSPNEGMEKTSTGWTARISVSTESADDRRTASMNVRVSSPSKLFKRVEQSGKSTE